jgi:hypothetical protein
MISMLLVCLLPTFFFLCPPLPSYPFLLFKISDTTGIILLEIGVWESALIIGGTGIGDGRNPLKVKKWYLKQAERRLESKMGRKYKELVLRCLTGEFGIRAGMDYQSELKLQQAFRREVVDVLERAVENV